MATIARIQANLAGWTGGPGVSTFYWQFHEGEEIADAGQAATDLRGMYNALKDYIVSGVTINIEPTVDLVEHTTGELVGRFSITPPAGVAGSAGTSASNRATMLKTRFLTSQIRAGRLMRGGVFIGPIGSAAMDTSGQIPTTTINAVSAAFAPILAWPDPGLLVWGRPIPFDPGPPMQDAREGAIGYVTSVSCAPRPGTLRSRRD